MKPIPGALQTILQNSESLPFAECFDLSTSNGQTFFYTNLDIPVQIGTTFYYANSVRVEGMRFKITNTMTVDEQDITCYALPTDTVNNVPFMQALRTGVFDGGFVRRQRAFFDPATWPPNPGDAPTAIGSVQLFYGRISGINSIGRTQADLKVKSVLALLDIGMPRNCYTASCVNTLYDGACTLNAATFTSSGTVGSGSGPTNINWAGANQSYVHGTFSVTNGVDIYDVVTVSGATNGATLFLARPLRFMPAVGDTFNVTQGCDHTLTTCANKFLNQRNFRGFPYVPPAEMSF
jgi:hypothetical protein